MPMESLPLRDIHLPDPIGWWPLAPGWWGLLALLISLIGILVYVIRRRRRVTPIKQALAELAQLEADGEMTAVQKVQALSILMKRVALSFRSREEVAGLAGQDWLKLLDQLFDSDQYTQGAGRYLAESPYRRKVSNSGLSELCQLLRSSLSQLSDQRRITGE